MAEKFKGVYVTTQVAKPNTALLRVSVRWAVTMPYYGTRTASVSEAPFFS